MMTLNLLDICIIMTMAISAIIGLFRGMTKELITLVTWIMAGILGLKYGAVVGAMFTSVSTDMIKGIIGSSLIFIGVLIVGGIFNAIINKFVKISGFIFLDKVLGAVFGALRGVLIFMISIMIINDGFANFVNDKPLWKESILTPKLQAMAENVKSNFPKDWIQKYTEMTNSFKS